MDEQRAWRKVLYERQPYPDNFVDEQKFLDQLLTENSSRVSSILALLINASVLVQQFSVVVVFLSLYRYVSNLNMSTLHLVGLDVSFFLVTYVTNVMLRDDSYQENSYAASFRSLFIFGIALRILGPILQTLTLTYSDDTIYALVFILSTVHLVFFDYSFTPTHSTESFPGTLSLNAALLSSILLSSRLGDVDAVVAFVLLAVNCFSQFPMTAKWIRHRSVIAHLLLTIFLWGVASYLSYHVNNTVFCVFEGTTAFLWLVCPLWFYRLQFFKTSMRGPWDEASVEET